MILFFFVSLYSCDFLNSEQEVKEFFIEKVAKGEDKKTALKREIYWYKEPEILECYKKDLSGKDLIAFSYISEICVYAINDWTANEMRNLGADNPDTKVAELWYFSGNFTNFDEQNKFSEKRGYVLFVPKLLEYHCNSRYFISINSQTSLKKF